MMFLTLLIAFLAILVQLDFPLEFGNNLARAAVVVGFVKPSVIDAIAKRTG